MGYITPRLAVSWIPIAICGPEVADSGGGLPRSPRCPSWLGADLSVLPLVEYSSCFSKDFTDGRPGELDWKVLTPSDPAEKAKKLLAEIAKGRLYSAEVVGIFFGDGLTAAPGVTERCAQLPLVGPSRTNMASRLPWASGIPSRLS